MWVLAAVLACVLGGSALGQPLTTAFTFQGELASGGAPANGVFDVRFRLYDALLANDVPPARLVLNRQGAGGGTKFKPLRRMNEIPNVFRFGFLGRWDPVKGVHILVEAFKRVPADLPVELHICATGTGTASEKYRRDVQRAAAI